MKTIGPWTIRSVKTAYQNPWVRLDHHEVTRPDGADGIYGVVRFANLAIGVLPLFEDGTTVLVGQHRFPSDQYSWELPEGGGPEGQTPEETAHRELAEETGLRAAFMSPLGEAQLSNSVTDEYAYYFVAWGLEQGVAMPEPDEILKIRRLPFRELLGEVNRGEITDSLTILMVQGAVIKALSGLLPDQPQRIILSSLEGLRGFR